MGWDAGSVNRIMDYVAGKFDFEHGDQLRMVLRNVFNAAANMPKENRAKFIHKMLDCTFFDEYEMSSFENGSIPKYDVYPVHVEIKRYYTVYARVRRGAPTLEIMKSAVKKVIDEQNEALCEDPDMEIEEGDIHICEIDFNGVQESYE